MKSEEFCEEQFSDLDTFRRMRWTAVDLSKAYEALGVPMMDGQRKVSSIAGHFTAPAKLLTSEKLIKGRPCL